MARAVVWLMKARHSRYVGLKSFEMWFNLPEDDLQNGTSGANEGENDEDTSESLKNLIV